MATLGDHRSRETSDVTAPEITTDGDTITEATQMAHNTALLDDARLSNTSLVPPVSRRKPLINRISFFGLIIAVCAVFANIILNYKPRNPQLGFISNALPTLGVFWSEAFAFMIVGPGFAFLGSHIRKLDVLPAFGTSLFVVLSVTLNAVIVNYFMMTHPCVNNLLLFGLIYANVIAVLLNLQRQIRVKYNMPWFNKPGRLNGEARYVFKDGECYLEKIGASHPSRRIMSYLSVPVAAVRAYSNLRDKSSYFLRGENLHGYKLEFALWRAEARRVRMVFLLRRMFCLVGYVIETTTLYLCFVVLNFLKGYNYRDGKSGITSLNPLCLPVWQIVLVVLFSFCSDYFWALLIVRRTGTTPVEDSSVMLLRLSSCMDWSGRKSRYLQNGSRLQIPWWASKYEEIEAGALPTIGIVGDRESVPTGLTVLRSTVAGCRLSVRRIEEGLIRTQILGEDELERARFQEERVVVAETDVVI